MKRTESSEEARELLAAIMGEHDDNEYNPVVFTNADTPDFPGDYDIEVCYRGKAGSVRIAVDLVKGTVSMYGFPA